MEKMLKICIWGFGFMGKTHASNILQMENVKLCGIITKNKTSLVNSFKKDAGNIKTNNISEDFISTVNIYESFDDCIKNEKPDIMVIALPTDLHYMSAKLCLSNNIHVFMEKPISLDIEKAEDLVKLSKKNKITFMIAHVVRFSPEYEYLKESVDSLKYGKLKHIHLYRISGKPNWGMWKNKDILEKTGGALFDMTVHDIDFLNYLLGKPDNLTSHNIEENKIKNYVVSFWQYNKGNISAFIEGGFDFHSTTSFEAKYIAKFENSTLMYSSNDSGIINNYTNENHTKIDVSDNNDGYYNEMKYFLDCVINKTNPKKCLPESSIDSIKLAKSF